MSWGWKGIRWGVPHWICVKYDINHRFTIIFYIIFVLDVPYCAISFYNVARIILLIINTKMTLCATLPHWRIKKYIYVRMRSIHEPISVSQCLTSHIIIMIKNGSIWISIWQCGTKGNFIYTFQCLMPFHIENQCGTIRHKKNEFSYIFFFNSMS